ncbi:MAG: hypothetical protein KDK74_17145, partial [Cephaloticoccus sp.]|nr:hypothetical protein [Cephaloticoccus sp.]
MLASHAASILTLASEAAAPAASGDFALVSVQALVALLTLTALEIVLGIDNVIFIAILAGKLPKEKQARARNMGLLLAMAQRILLLFAIAWIVSLQKEVFNLFGQSFSWKDIILLV